MKKIIEFLKTKKAEILAIIVLTSTFLFIKEMIDSETRNYIDSVASILLLGTTAVSIGMKMSKQKIMSKLLGFKKSKKK